MAIGTQRGVRVYLKVYDWVQLICRTGRFLTALLFTLIIMITSAHAAVETVKPESGGCYSVQYVGCFGTALEGCKAWFELPGSYLISFTYTPANDINGGYCEARDSRTGTSFSSHASYLDATCPVPPVNPQNAYVYNRATGICERTVQDECPIPKLPDFPLPTDDSCTKSLEKGAGKDVDKVCPPLDDRWTKPNGGQLQCLANKISKLGLSVPYTEPSATIRTVAYQNHLLALWKKSLQIASLKKTEDKLACVSLDAKIKGDMAIHGIDAPPSKKEGDAPHVLGKAIDIPRRVKNALIAKVSN